MSGSGVAVGGGGALAAATGTAEGGSVVFGNINMAGSTVEAIVMPDGQLIDATFTGTEQSYQGFEVREVKALPVLIDYTTMSGAEFQRAVGVDPVKWAEAFLQVTATASVPTKADQIALVTKWFRDAMDAAQSACDFDPVSQLKGLEGF